MKLQNEPDQKKKLGKDEVNTAWWWAIQAAKHHLSEKANFSCGFKDKAT